jgi:hypothetical protein
MNTYQISLVATVYAEVEVEAETEDEARELAYEAIGDDYEVDFSIESVFEVA